MTSPASRVKFFEIKAIIWGILKIMLLVFDSCTIVQAAADGQVLGIATIATAAQSGADRPEGIQDFRETSRPYHASEIPLTGHH